MPTSGSPPPSEFELHRLRIESWPATPPTAIRPFATDQLPVPPKERARAYHERFHRLSEDAARRTGFDPVVETMAGEPRLESTLT